MCIVRYTTANTLAIYVTDWNAARREYLVIYFRPMIDKDKAIHHQWFHALLMSAQDDNTTLNNIVRTFCRDLGVFAFRNVF